MAHEIAIVLPADLNGIGEVGIAAGVDEFVTPGFVLKVALMPNAATGIAMNEYDRYHKCRAAANAYIAQCVAATDDGVYRALIAGPEREAAIIAHAAAAGIPRMVDITPVLDEIENFPADSTIATKKDMVTIVAENVRFAVDPGERVVNEAPCDRFEIDVSRTLVINKYPVAEDMSKALINGIIAFICSNGWICRHAAATKNLVEYIYPRDIPADERTGLEVNAEGFWEPQKVANLLVAIKIAWWLTNHHVGQVEGEIAGFAGKVAKIQKLYVPGEPGLTQNNETRNILWFAGKLITTRGILHPLGIGSVQYRDREFVPGGNDYAWAGVIRINASSDVALRIGSSPAGTAQNLTYLAIARKASRSNYAICVPSLSSYGKDVTTPPAVETGDIITYETAVKANPSRYHMGSQFLTGQNRIVNDIWSEEDRENLAAFIYATSKGSSLLRPQS